MTLQFLNCTSLLLNKYGHETPLISPNHLRLRCLGHILNLAAKALLFGKSAEAFEYSNINELGPETEEEKFVK